MSIALIAIICFLILVFSGVAFLSKKAFEKVLIPLIKDESIDVFYKIMTALILVSLVYVSILGAVAIANQQKFDTKILDVKQEKYDDTMESIGKLIPKKDENTLELSKVNLETNLKQKMSNLVQKKEEIKVKKEKIRVSPFRLYHNIQEFEGLQTEGRPPSMFSLSVLVLLILITLAVCFLIGGLIRSIKDKNRLFNVLIITALLVAVLSLVSLTIASQYRETKLINHKIEKKVESIQEIENLINNSNPEKSIKLVEDGEIRISIESLSQLKLKTEIKQDIVELIIEKKKLEIERYRIINHPLRLFRNPS